MTDNVEPGTVSELFLEGSATEVSVPYTGREYICPDCRKPISTRKQINMTKPADYAHLLNDVQKCPHCSFIFSYRSKAVVLRK